MASIIKNQILKHLSKFAKNLSHDSIGLSLLRGEGNLTNLELDENVLMDVLELPSWINLKKAVCNKVSVKIPWTKLKTNPICVYLDMVEVQLETCRTIRKTSTVNEQLPTQMSSSGKYGFAEKVLDGMYIHVNSVSGTFVSDTFHADIQIAQLLVQSKTPEWQLSDLRTCRVKDVNRGEVITFKEVEWSTLRLIIDATESVGTNRTTTPIRLITNQGMVRVSLKKRLDDCSLVSSRLQVLLDDILWVLTDSQLKAVILHFRSLFPVIQKATELSKARASNKAQSVPLPRPFSTDPTNRPHNVKNNKELQMLQFFEKYDVIETSYHLHTRHIDLHLCDEMNQTADDELGPNSPEEWAKRRVDGGAMQVSLNGLSLDYYPFHTASSNRNHWEYFDEAMKISDKWIHTLLAHFKQQYANTRKQLEKQHNAARSGHNRDKGHTEDKVHAEDNLKDGKTPKESKAFKHSSSSKQLKSSGSNAQDKVQSSKGQGSSTSKQPATPVKQSVKLMSHGAVMRLQDFQFNCVQTGKNRTETLAAGGQQVLIKSEKSTFCLPSEMPSLHIEYLSFYFPNELDFPVPSPVAYVQLNPVQFKLDYTSVLWLNQFASNILQTLPDTEGMVPDREGRDHIDIRFDALMPKIIIPAESPVDDQPDRPQELHIQISQLTATNCRTGTSSPRPELSRLLQHFYGLKLYHDLSSFPNMADDLTPMPQLFWQHAYEPNFYMPKEFLQTKLELCSNGSIPGVNGKHDPGISGVDQFQPVKLTTYSFRPDSVNDVWNIKIEQIWADFYGMASSKDRPVPFLDPLSLNVWMCWPNNAHLTSISQSHSRTDVNPTISQSLNKLYQPNDQSESKGITHSPPNNSPPKSNSSHGEKPNSTPPPENQALKRNSDYSTSQDSLASQTSSEGRTNSSFEDLTPISSSRVRQSHSQDSFRTSDADTDADQFRHVLKSVGSRSSVLSPLESEASTVCGGSDHTLASRLSTENVMGDVHYIVQVPGSMKLTVQHYQVLFLLRLQQSLQKLMEDIESDQVLYSNRSAPVITKAVAFCCPVIEANLILSPIADPDIDNDSIATSAHGEYPTERGSQEGHNEEGHTRQKLFEVGMEDSTSVDMQTDGFVNDYSSQLPRFVMDKLPGGNMSFTRTRSQPSVAAYQEGPPGATIVNESGQDLHRARSSSIPHRNLSNESDRRERRKSQEIGPNLSANSIPTIQAPLLAPDSTSLPPHRSYSESLLTQVGPVQQGQNQLFLSSQTNRPGSMNSLDDTISVDLDIMSIDSDSSDGFMALMRGDRSSTASGSLGGLEMEPESGIGSETSHSASSGQIADSSRVLNIFQQTGMQNSSPVPSATSDSGVHTAIPLDEQFKNNKHKLKAVSMVTFHLVNVDAVMQLLGLDSASKVQVHALEREEKGNMDYNKLLAQPPAGEKNSQKVEQRSMEDPPLVLLRFQSGPKAENLAPCAGERGCLEMQVNGLDHDFLMSTITHVSSLTADEINSEAMPMKICINQAKVVLQDDTPPSYPTYAGSSIPLKLDVPCLTINRTYDGVFHITGSSKSTREEDNAVLDEDQDSPSSHQPSVLKNENVQLRGQVVMMKDALNVLEHERSSLLSTLEHLQEELLTADRRRDTLQMTITDLQRQINIR